MTVSGLGSARATTRPPLTPPNRTPRADRPEQDKQGLTAADRELVFQVTGQRPDQSVTGFAAVLAAERAAGRLAIGQEVTAVYLKDLNRRYERAAGANPLDGHLDKAIAVLTRIGARRVDVTA